ncbi:MAG TPA: hypothetical protein VMV52_02295 [Candidatus Nanopelagicaceae bacterium]|nr:hypothetical protein [Candidatus Nanopelagicaceae bacterium]
MKVFGRAGRTSRSLSIVGTLAIAALGLSACASSVGVAGTVGGQDITINRVQASVDAITAERKAAALPPDPKATDLPRNQLRFFVLSALLKAAGDAAGVKVTQSDIDGRRKAILTQLGGAAKLPSALANAGIAKSDFDTYLYDVAYEALIGAALAPTAAADSSGDQARGAAVQKAVLDASQKAKVSINPRYGTWDETTQDIIPVDTTGGAVKKK